MKILCLLLLPFINAELSKRFKPDWNDLDTRIAPHWYTNAKIGIFLHWGVYSVPSFETEWFWEACRTGQKPLFVKFMQENYPPKFTYQDFAPMFTAEFFNATEWGELFRKAGAKYVVLTSKHHEGFTLFPSNRSFSWNAMDVGPRRDLVGELAAGVRHAGLKFGVYHSLIEWYNPIFLEDQANEFRTTTYTDTKLWPDLKQLVNDYKPSILWADGDWPAIDKYWKSQQFIAWLYNDSPVKDEVLTNDRWGLGTQGRHGDFYNIADNYNPGVLQHHLWENAFTMDKKSWGYRRNMHINDVYTLDELLRQMVMAVSCGGNVLINIGPTKEGTIIPIFQERLLALGAWLNINGEAIYNSSPWKHQNDTISNDVWYTRSISDGVGHATSNVSIKYNNTRPKSDAETIYAIMLKWPEHGELLIKDIVPQLQSGKYKILLLGNPNIKVKAKIHDGIAVITLPDKAVVKSTNAWTLKITKS